MYTRPTTWRTRLDVIRVCCMLFLLVGLAWIAFGIARASGDIQQKGHAGAQRQSNAMSLPSEPISLASADRLGNPVAPITVLEFADFQSPLCRLFVSASFASIRKSLIDTGRVAFAFRHFPLSMHPGAMGAATVAECASRQGRFWSIHDAFFAVPATARLNEYADASLGFGVARSGLDACLGDHADVAVREDLREGRQLGVKQTPAFLFGRTLANERMIGVKWAAGAMSIEAFEKIVNDIFLEASAKGLQQDTHRLQSR
jgi:protein-disulfide isomerase